MCTTGFLTLDFPLTIPSYCTSHFSPRRVNGPLPAQRRLQLAEHSILHCCLRARRDQSRRKTAVETVGDVVAKPEAANLRRKTIVRDAAKG